MSFCRYHPNTAAVGLCMRCRAPVCAACTTRLDGVNHCHACLRALGSRGEEAHSGIGWRPVLAVILTFFGAAMLFAGLLFLQGRLAP